MHVAADLPVELSFSAYWPTSWTLNLSPGAKVKKIYLTGRYQQTVVNAPASVQIIDFGPGSRSSNDPYTQRLVARGIEIESGLTASSVQGGVAQSEFLVRNIVRQPLPAQYEVHFITVNPYHSLVTVKVNQSVPVVLVLSACGRIEWRLEALNDSKIAKVIYNNCSNTKITGAPIDSLFGSDYGVYPYLFPSQWALDLIDRVSYDIVGTGTTPVHSYQTGNAEEFLVP